MSMHALNQLVARSIIDPGVVQAFSAGRIGEILAEFDFGEELRRWLSSLEATTWAEYAVLAFRAVKAAEVPAVRIQLPSPAEGLLINRSRSEEEQVA